jgi:hypothetical protein
VTNFENHATRGDYDGAVHHYVAENGTVVNRQMSNKPYAGMSPAPG